MTSAYLSVVGHNDQLHILGRCLRVAFVLEVDVVRDTPREEGRRRKNDIRRTHLTASL